MQTVSHIEGTPFARHASERGQGTLEGVPDNSWMEYRPPWGGVSVALICDFTQRESRQKEAMGLKAWLGHVQSHRDRNEGVGWWPIEYFFESGLGVRLGLRRPDIPARKHRNR